MKIQNSNKTIYFVKILNNTSKETLGLLSAAYILNKKFPNITKLTASEMDDGANYLSQKSNGSLSVNDSLNVVRILYGKKLYSTCIN